MRARWRSARAGHGRAVPPGRWAGMAASPRRPRGASVYAAVRRGADRGGARRAPVNAGRAPFWAEATGVDGDTCAVNAAPAAGKPARAALTGSREDVRI